MHSSLKALTFVLTLVFCTYSLSAQKQKVGLYAAGFATDNLEPTTFDDSFEWDYVTSRSYAHFVLEFQSAVSKKLSLTAQVGYADQRMILWDDVYSPNGRLGERNTHSYYPKYVYGALFLNYHFKDDFTGLQISAGPRYNHKLGQDFEARTFDMGPEPTPFFENLSSSALDFELRALYVFKLFKVFNRRLDLAIGPRFNLNVKSFFSKNVETSNRTYKGFTIGLNLWLDNNEDKAESEEH